MGWLKSSIFVPDGFKRRYYKSLRKLAALSVGLCVCLSVMRGSVRTMKFYVFLCLFHVVAIKLEFWNFAYAFLASIPICMHGFIMIRILLLPFAYVLKILNYFFSFSQIYSTRSSRTSRIRIPVVDSRALVSFVDEL